MFAKLEANASRRIHLFVEAFQCVNTFPASTLSFDHPRLCEH